MLLVVRVTAGVSGVTAIKYQNRAHEGEEIGFDRAQAQKQVTMA